MKRERTDFLRRRPKVIRYFFLAGSYEDTLHVGMSHGGLEAVIRNSGGIRFMYVADVVTEKVRIISEEAEDFLARWSYHYNDDSWDYFKEVEDGVPVPKIVKRGD